MAENLSPNEQENINQPAEDITNDISENQVDVDTNEITATTEGVETSFVVSEEQTVEEEKPLKNSKKSKKNTEKEEKVEEKPVPTTYEEIESERLFARKKKKRIISIVSLSVVFVVALVVILMACIKVNIMPKCLEDSEIYSIKVCVDGQTPTESKRIITDSEGTSEAYDLFMKSYKKMFRVSFLNAWFSGQLSDYDIIEHIEDNYTKNTVESNFASSSSNYFYITYLNEVNLTTKNGANYVSKYNSNYEIKFNSAYLEVFENNNVQDISIYLVVDYPSGNNSTLTRIVELKLRANTHSLYKQLDSLR